MKALRSRVMLCVVLLGAFFVTTSDARASTLPDPIVTVLTDGVTVTIQNTCCYTFDHSAKQPIQFYNPSGGVSFADCASSPSVHSSGGPGHYWAKVYARLHGGLWRELHPTASSPCGVPVEAKKKPSGSWTVKIFLKEREDDCHHAAIIASSASYGGQAVSVVQVDGLAQVRAAGLFSSKTGQTTTFKCNAKQSGDGTAIDNVTTDGPPNGAKLGGKDTIKMRARNGLGHCKLEPGVDGATARGRLRLQQNLESDVTVGQGYVLFTAKVNAR